MGLHSDSGGGEAVIFFNDNLDRPQEMLYLEFEAVLDSFIGLPDFANQTKRAAYLRIDGYLNITAIVFFLIKFDDLGAADKKWNLPLRELADSGGYGPDLGAGGAIKLNCHSQCDDSRYQQFLWEPKSSREDNEYVTLRKIVKDNRLGIVTAKLNSESDQRYVAVNEQLPSTSSAITSAMSSNKDGHDMTSQANSAEFDNTALRNEVLVEDLRIEITQQISKQYQNKLREKLSELMQTHKSEFSEYDNEQKRAVDVLKREQQTVISDQLEQIEDLRQQLIQMEEINNELKQRLNDKAIGMAAMEEQLAQHEWNECAAEQQANASSLEQQLSTELKDKLEQENFTLQEMIRMRDIELYYRYEQETCMRDELAILRAEGPRLTDDDGDYSIDDLHAGGITFVVFHPGAGHLTLPREDIEKYIEHPQAYVAAKCGVSLEIYQQWLYYTEAPYCQVQDEEGNICGEVVESSELPSQFIPGVSDRCNKHMSVVASTGYADTSNSTDDRWDTPKH